MSVGYALLVPTWYAVGHRCSHDLHPTDIDLLLTLALFVLSQWP